MTKRVLAIGKALPVILLAAVTAVGLWALAERMIYGLQLANFTSISPWGLWMALYIYFIGLSAGSFLISSLVFVFGVKRFQPVGRLALIQALGCLLIGLTLVGIDIGRPERGYRLLMNWSESSVLAWEVLFYVAYMSVLCLEIWILVRPDFSTLAGKARRGWARTLYRWASFTSPGEEDRREDPHDSKLLKRLAIAGIPLAIGVHGGTGMIFAVLKARPYWYTGLFPIIFIVSALVSGGALLTLLTTLFLNMNREKKLPIVQGLARLTAFILMGDLFLIAVESFVALYGNSPEHSIPYLLIMTGPFWWVFWIVQILLGSVIPLVLILGPGKNSLKALGVAAGMIVVGIVGVRLNIVIPPLQTSWAGGLPEAYHNSVSAIGYVPSLNEWLCSLGILALGAWGFLLVRKVVPLTPAEPEDNR